ncbi:hypothetical protein HOO14_06585, partial [bacterium]|nr:hypothetical protein [bacterium]
SNTIDILEKKDIKVTWFVTHDTPLLKRLRNNSNFELGIHPNFNFLLQGDFKYGGTDSEVIDHFLKIVPGAKSVRSHSLTQSSRLSSLFSLKGLTHESNMFIPEYSKMDVKPFKHVSGMTICPYIWGDYLDFSLSCNKSNFKETVLLSGLKIFNFHPIHIYLNTDSIEMFESTRNLHYRPQELYKYRNMDLGVRDRFLELLSVEYKKPMGRVSGKYKIEPE